MDSKVVQSEVQDNDEHSPHNVGSQQEEHHHDQEKKSVLNKVKARAKKIKDTIKKHGHHVLDHGHEYNNEDQHIPDDHDLNEDEERVEDPEADGGPVYESEAIKSATPKSEQVNNLGNSGVNFGGAAVVGEEPHQEPRVVGVSPSPEINQNKATDPDRIIVGEEKPGQTKVNLERPIGLEEDAHLPGRPEAYTPLNNQTKVTDPPGAGTAEIDITPIGKSFERMNIHIHDETKPSPEAEVQPNVAETQYPSAGSHDQFVQDPSTETETQHPSAEILDQYIPELSSATKTQYSSAGSHDQFLPDISTETTTQHPSAEIHDQYMPELSTATETQYPPAGSHDQFAPDLSTETTTQYPSAGSHHDQFAPQTLPTITNNRYLENPEATGQTFNTTTTTVEEQPSYESVEEPQNHSSYTDKAVSSENAISSKLVYGEKGDREDKVTSHEEQKESGEACKMSGSTAEYGKNIAHSLTEKLAPVYGKVAEAGSAVKSKVSGTKPRDSTGVGIETESGVKEQDKGVSVKDYLAEKLRPGEEDKALSEVISETLQLHEPKEEPTASGDEDRDVTKVISDAIHKQEEEPVKKDHRNLGSVDGKSEKVSEESSVNSPGKGVVDKLKGVVGSWFGKSGENQSSKVAGAEDLSKNKNSGAEVEHVSQAEGERSPQE